ncbi:hypothetical protein LUZ61_002389 [Rhynchospora tenuis]|uniref:Aminotransferase-like plant mobile domain-containing protein n=1 Tax=Rhynchospora tenuis TaxID=198213 RepID=A0AAD5ZJ97_9POAL|nr:hypothetical protein LUZ61_002389 [Rhynchospora tenuis]
MERRREKNEGVGNGIGTEGRRENWVLSDFLLLRISCDRNLCGLLCCNPNKLIWYAHVVVKEEAEALLMVEGMVKNQAKVLLVVEGMVKSVVKASNQGMKLEWLHRPRSRRMIFRYDERILPILQQYGLEHIARVTELSIDHSLITALVERCRRETHSFHQPTGEITVALQDVSCLWGLSINGAPVIGISDDHWEEDVLSAFGRDEAWAAFRRPPGMFHMRMGWLREPWVPPTTRDREFVAAELSEDANEEQVLYFARSYMMDLFGSVMFPDHSGRLYSMFVQIIYSESPRIYSWASAVLAFLYRGLCRASGSSREIAAPFILLQMWSWTRFPVGRPIRHDFGDEGLGGAPYGLFWLVPHDFSDTARYNIGTYRRKFEELVDDDVNWTPYDGIMDELPEICRDAQEQRLWYYEGPLIWFWIIEMYTPQRVMRHVWINLTCYTN